MTKNTGGYAFPIIQEHMNVEGGPGMTLRDWFAGQALVAIRREIDGRPERAEYCYAMADAMLAERSKP